jgi:hypothetical protein
MGQKFEISLRIEEINQVLSVLGKQPYDTVYLLIDSIRSQVQSQIDAEAALANMGSSEG